jgi:hypothetical protein
MSTADRARADYSKGHPGLLGASGRVGATRWVLIAVAVAGASVLIVSDFLTLYEVKVLTVVKRSVAGHDQHSFGMALIGLAALAMAVGVARSRARSAMAAVAALGIAALLIALLVDLPDVNSTGLIGQLYESAAAGPKAGFYLETLGAVALIFSGISMLALGAPRGIRRAGPPQQPATRQAPAPSGGSGGQPSTAPADGQDAGWF